MNCGGIALVYALAMRHSLVHCAVALVLLMQGLGSAWAASRMAAAELQPAAHVAAMPPCHSQTAAETQGKAVMHCCGTSLCPCLMACGAVPALAFSLVAALLPRQLETLGEPSPLALQAGHYGLPLRPPVALQG